jgi:multicomponent Na+:H+ antiporter subunit B
VTLSVFILLALVLFLGVFGRVIADYSELQHLRPLAVYYVTQAPIELGVANIVTGILITYRGFDTLGEVAVLFMVAASVGILLDTGQAPVADVEIAPSRRAPSEIVATSRQVLLPLILAFGAYVIVNGHLSAGGGFQGGAIVASGLMLQLLARPNTRMHLGVLSVTESLAGIVFVSLGILGMVFAGGFLDGRFLPLGEFGAFISAGVIPLISALLGIKVGAELSVIVDRFRS